MKVLVFSGSPRPEGSTARVMEMVVQGALEAAPGLDVKHYDLNKLSFSGCQGCRVCKSETATGCVVQDDMTSIHQEMMEAEAWIIGTPIYMAGVSGQLKLFLDRMYGFTGPNWSNRLPAGKRAVVVLTQGMAEEGAYQSVVELLSRMLVRRGFASVESVVAGAAREDEINARDELVQKAHAAGAKLVQK